VPYHLHIVAWLCRSIITCVLVMSAFIGLDAAIDRVQRLRALSEPTFKLRHHVSLQERLARDNAAQMGPTKEWTEQPAYRTDRSGLDWSG
jgi:hypothetical protein